MRISTARWIAAGSLFNGIRLILVSLWAEIMFLELDLAHVLCDVQAAIPQALHKFKKRNQRLKIH
jgi:hypothetical protein